jgi:hypothetical protein
VNYLINALSNVLYNGLDLVKDNFMPQTHMNSQADEAVWQAWLKKNKEQDQFRYERRVRVLALVAVFVVVIALLGWFTGVIAF